MDKFGKAGKLHIVITDDYQDAVRNLTAFKKVASHQVTVYRDTVKDLDLLGERLKDAEVLIPVRERTFVTEALLDRMPRLRMISQSGSGVAHIDIDACTRRGIPVAAGGKNAHAPAELTWSLVLAAMRHLPQEVSSAKAGRWQSSPIGTSLRGRTLGILGYGNIGSIVAGYGKAFGMRVVVWGREGSLSRAQADGYEAASSKEAFFEQCDVLCIHLRLNEGTKASITSTDLARMKPTALLVNTSRAELISKGALVDALHAGRPGFAAVDTYENEPATDDPLLQLDNAICSPHLGYVERDTYEAYFGAAFDNLLAFEAGNPINIVNPGVWARS